MPPLVVTNRMDPVDLALCLAIDVSASVDYDEFGLMVGGYAAAFRDPGIIAACAAGPRGAIAVAMLFWSGGWPSMGPAAGRPEVAVPWTAGGRAGGRRRAGRCDRCRPAPAAARRHRARARAWRPVSPCWPAARRRPRRLVMDVSGDGRHNQGRAPGPVRDIGVAAGVTINGLAVLNEEPDLLEHYLDRGDRRPRQLRHGLPGLRRLRRGDPGKAAREIGGASPVRGRMGYLHSAA